ncbi:non-muscle caldesmon-like isoform X3 [Myxocyprinus asiaticus]|uniref:non-muscle caldesmon-like isoform X3 n=1 Tax=Myxocyprinus asiaticus TaxID=70543 RepID=UPI002221D644|nr:non-muscle caldesmon-like isoform X3 [Myxocyprinus asiaticus]
MDEDFDIERRRELRRQKREEMQREAEKMKSQDDEEEAARECRRRARQERLRNMENEELSSTTTETYSSETSTLITGSAPAEDDDQALLDRIAKREERRQKRMMEALERQKELDPTIMDGNVMTTTEPSHRNGEQESQKETETNHWEEREEKKQEEKIKVTKTEVEETITVTPVTAAEEPKETPEKIEDKQGSYLKKQESTEEKPKEPAVTNKVMEEKPKPSFLRDKLKVTTKPHDTVDSTTKAKKPEKMLSPTGLRSPVTEKQDPIAKLEAERKLQELKRQRNETDSKVLEKMKQKQQTAQAELEELKKKREERKKILEEEEKQKKQQLAEKKAKEEEERKKMKEEIEHRRAEAAEKKKQKEESKEGSKPPFIAPKGASAKIGEKAEFLNKSALKSPVKMSHTPLVCKIGNRLEQYTTAVQTKEVAKSPKSLVDVPVAEGVRNIKSMWEKGNNVNPTSSPASPPAVTKETAGLNIGVAGRINSWKTKTPEQQKPIEPKPAPEPEKPAIKTDQKPADVTKTHSLWETKGSSPAKVLTARSKFVTNGTRK